MKFSQNKSRISTWHSPNGLSPINKTSTGTYPGAVINSDHDLVLCKLKLKLLSQKTKRSNRCRFNLDKLKDESV